MTKKMYRVVTEWDMGMKDYVYKSRKGAWRDLETAHRFMGPEGSFEDYVEEGLYSVEELEVVEFDFDNE